MKFLKFSLLVVISLLTFPQFVLSAETGSTKRKDLAGFVIVANGSLTATNAEGVSRVLVRRSQFYANEILKTGKDSSAQLRFTDRSLMTLKADSQLNIQDYHFGGVKDKANKSVMNLVTGGFRTISGSIGKRDKSAYRITTPAASIGIRGTDYEIIISLGGKVFAAVHEGGISLVNDLGDLDLGADSDYVFAEVSPGQAPFGLDELPEVFKVQDGKKQALTDEQKAQLAKKLAEGQDKLQSLLAKLGNGEGNEVAEGLSDADRQQALIEELIEAGAIDTRIVPDLLEKIKQGRVAINVSNPAGEIALGSSYTQEGETLFLTDDDRLYAFEVTALEQPTGHSNVYWGTWNEGQVLGLNGTRLDFETSDQFFISALALDADKIQNLKGSVELDLAALVVSTNVGGQEFASLGEHSGSATLNFDNGTVEGNMSMILDPLVDDIENVQFDIEFDGAMLTTDNQLNHDFNATANAQLMDSDSSTALALNNEVPNPDTIDVSLIGIVVAPSVEDDITTAGFAGHFEAVLPTEVTDGVNVNVRAGFVFANPIQATRAYF